MLLMPWFDRKRRTFEDTGCCVSPSRLGFCQMKVVHLLTLLSARLSAHKLNT